MQRICHAAAVENRRNKNALSDAFNHHRSGHSSTSSCVIDITFHILNANPREANPEYRDSPYISLAQSEHDLARLENADEVVIDDACISVEYDYPLRTSATAIPVVSRVHNWHG